MSTRGVYGFRVNELDKVAYAPADAHPEGLGRRILTYISSKSPDAIRDMALKLRFISPEGNQSPEETFLFRDDALGIVDSAEFLSDNVYCNWAYIINVDTSLLEVHSGGKHTPSSKGRYISAFQANSEFRGVKLINEIPLDLITPNSIDYHIKAMSAAQRNDYLTQLVIEQDKSNNDLQKQLNSLGRRLELGNFFMGLIRGNKQSL